MSGVMGLVSLDGRPIPQEVARAQLAAIDHRGDGVSGVWFGDGIALGHALRATTPEAEGERLPAAGASGRYWLTWDGRLDNREELAALLGLSAEGARQMTDAAFVIAAYERWGDDAVEHLLGDWSIVIWDNLRRRLFCAKDPLGWRPIYFGESNGLLAVGSEPLQITTGHLMPVEPNYDYLLRFIGGAQQQPRVTCYEGVQELQGGETLVVEAGRYRVETYRTGPRIRERRYRDAREYVDEFAAIFDVAVRARMRSNRPIGVFLSGGHDSSYVTAIAAQHTDLTAISTHVPGTMWDERVHQEAVVQALDIPWHSIDISDCWALNPRYLPDEAIDHPDVPPQHGFQRRVAIAAADEGLTVTLGGEGGDEWLAGNEHYIASALVAGRLPTAWRLAMLRLKNPSRRGAVRQLGKAAVNGLLAGPAQRGLQRLRGRETDFQIETYVDGEDDWLPAWESVATTAWRHNSVIQSEWAAYRNIAMNHISWRDRQVYQRHGIEHRTPFNDLRVIEMMASTPEWVKRLDGRAKYPLRQAEYRVLPETVAGRDDFGLLNDLVRNGLVERERSRAGTGIDAICDAPGVHADELRTTLEDWLRPDVWRPWHTTWYAIAAGLWLQNLGTQRSVQSPNALSRVATGVTRNVREGASV